MLQCICQWCYLAWDWGVFPGRCFCEMLLGFLRGIKTWADVWESGESSALRRSLTLEMITDRNMSVFPCFYVPWTPSRSGRGPSEVKGRWYSNCVCVCFFTPSCFYCIFYFYSQNWKRKMQWMTSKFPTCCFTAEHTTHFVEFFTQFDFPPSKVLLIHWLFDKLIAENGRSSSTVFHRWFSGDCLVFLSCKNAVWTTPVFNNRAKIYKAGPWCWFKLEQLVINLFITGSPRGARAPGVSWRSGSTKSIPPQLRLLMKSRWKTSRSD